jgi:1,4-alpha-glucan branching enzyme
LLTSEAALYINQFKQEGFEWVNLEHRQECVIVYKRKGKEEKDDLLIILNLTPIVRWNWEIEVYGGKTYETEIFNSDSKKYWGSGDVYNPSIRQELLDKENKKFKLTVNLPPLSGIVLK